MPLVQIIFLSLLVALEFFIPLRTTPVAQILCGGFFISLGYQLFSRRSAPKEFSPAFSNETNRAQLTLVVFLLIWIFSMHYLAQVFEVFGFHGTLWDLTMYLQESYNYSINGTPQGTFPGEVINYFHTHRSISLEILRLINMGLLKLTSESTIFLNLFWNSFFLLAPGLVGILWMREVQKKQGGPLPLMTAFLAVLTWLMMPTVLRMETWPYVFHIMGPCLLALAYLFYYREKWLLWALFLILLAYEKEDFGVVSCGFGLTAILGELLALRKNRQIKWQPLVLGITVIAGGAFSFLNFHAGSASLTPFSARFSSLGTTPTMVLQNIFLRPDLVFAAVTRTQSLSYAFFFFFCSFIWIFPKWKIVRFFLPVLPILFFNLIADHATMQLLKEMYALPIMVGVYATLLLGVYPHVTQTERYSSAFKKIGISPLLCLPFLLGLWEHQSMTRTFKDGYGFFRSHATERAQSQDIKKDRRALICCEERICSYFADRPYLLENRFCHQGHPLFDEFLKASQGRVFFMTHGAHGETPLDIKSSSK